MLENSSQLPQWLLALLTDKFFNACLIHEDVKKNEKNVFCLDCCEGLCPHCLSLHRSHRLLQSYTTNRAKVVFLNQRPQARPSRVSGNLCITCDRALQDSYLFCSLCCKLQHVLRTGAKLSKYIRNNELIAWPEPGLDDGQMTPDSVLETTGSVRTESGSSSGGGAAALVDCLNLSCTATTEVVRKKRSSVSGFRSAFRPVSEISEAMMNRRKGTPHRSPLY